MTAVGAWAVAIGWASWGGQSPGLVAAGVVYLGACVALTLHDRLRNGMKWLSLRTLAWVLVILTASFLPLMALTGAWRGESSLFLLPAAGASYLAPFASPWLCLDGTRWRDGRLTPVLLSWLSVALALYLSSFG